MYRKLEGHERVELGDCVWVDELDDYLLLGTGSLNELAQHIPMEVLRPIFEKAPVKPRLLVAGDWVRFGLSGVTKIGVVQDTQDGRVSILVHQHDLVIRRRVGEVTKITWVPFSSAAEFRPHRDQWLRTKDSKKGTCWRVTGFNDEGYADPRSEKQPYETLLEKCVWDAPGHDHHGLPCGMMQVEGEDNVA